MKITKSSIAIAIIFIASGGIAQPVSSSPNAVFSTSPNAKVPSAPKAVVVTTAPKAVIVNPYEVKISTGIQNIIDTTPKADVARAIATFMLDTISVNGEISAVRSPEISLQFAMQAVPQDLRAEVVGTTITQMGASGLSKPLGGAVVQALVNAATNPSFKSPASPATVLAVAKAASTAVVVASGSATVSSLSHPGISLAKPLPVSLVSAMMAQVTWGVGLTIKKTSTEPALVSAMAAGAAVGGLSPAQLNNFIQNESMRGNKTLAESRQIVSAATAEVASVQQKNNAQPVTGGPVLSDNASAAGTSIPPQSSQQTAANFIASLPATGAGGALSGQSQANSAITSPSPSSSISGGGSLGSGSVSSN